MKLKKIKEICDCKYIVSSEELYPLQKWYNQLIDKTVDDLTIADVLRMLRQTEFMDIAMPKAIEFLKDNVFAGETSEGELLGKLAETNNTFLADYTVPLKIILKDASNKATFHKWSYKGEGDEFKEILKCVTEKLYNI